MNAYSVKLVPPSGRDMTLVFRTTALQNSNGNSLSGGVKYTGGGEKWFSTKIAVYRGNGTK